MVSKLIVICCLLLSASNQMFSMHRDPGHKITVNGRWRSKSLALQAIADASADGFGCSISVQQYLGQGKTKVAYIDGKVAGFVNYCGYPKFFLCVPHGYINFLAVAPKMRGKGIGRFLLIVAIADLERQGYYTIKLDVISDNEPAIRLYRSMGFAPLYQYSNARMLQEFVRYNKVLKHTQESEEQSAGYLDCCIDMVNFIAGYA